MNYYVVGGCCWIQLIHQSNTRKLHAEGLPNDFSRLKPAFNADCILNGILNGVWMVCGSKRKTSCSALTHSRSPAHMEPRMPTVRSPLTIKKYIVFKQTNHNKKIYRSISEMQHDRSNAWQIIESCAKQKKNDWNKNECPPTFLRLVSLSFALFPGVGATHDIFLSDDFHLSFTND